MLRRLWQRLMRRPPAPTFPYRMCVETSGPVGPIKILCQWVASEIEEDAFWDETCYGVPIGQHPYPFTLGRELLTTPAPRSPGGEETK
jgi:hypothetical protein